MLWEVIGYVLFLYLSPQGFSSFRDGRGRLQVITVFTAQLARFVTLTASQGSGEVYWSELKVAVGVCGRVLDLSVCLRGKKPPHGGPDFEVLTPPLQVMGESVGCRTVGSMKVQEMCTEKISRFEISFKDKNPFCRFIVWFLQNSS